MSGPGPGLFRAIDEKSISTFAAACLVLLSIDLHSIAEDEHIALSGHADERLDIHRHRTGLLENDSPAGSGDDLVRTDN